MRIRRGLVSNSSASSFIFTLAKVINEEKFAAWNKSRKFIPCDGEKIATASEWELYDDRELYRFFESLEGDFLDRWGKETIIDMISKDPTAKYILAGEEESFEGDEEVFWTGNEYNWDAVDLSFFSQLQQDIYLAGKAEGLEVVAHSYYAARNG